MFCGPLRTVNSNMDKLPTEILFKIMLCLPPADRLSCSLTCRRFAEIMRSSQLLKDVSPSFADHELEAATSCLIESQRQYTRLFLYGVDLWDFDADFWEKIGADLRVLELDTCSWCNHVFYGVLLQCTKLESLKLGDGGEENMFSIRDLVPPEGTRHEELRDSLSHLRHLHLDIKLTAEVLDFLLGLMPKVTSIFLSSHIDEKTHFLERLPSIMKKNRIIRTGADFRQMAFETEEVIKFVEATSESLEELRIYAPTLTQGAFDAIAKCTRLRILTLGDLEGTISASDYKKFVSSFPDLEVLELSNICDPFLSEVDENIIHALGFRKLRSLSLNGLPRAEMTEDFLRKLVGITTLVKLDLREFCIDTRVLRRLSCLTNLRTLILSACEEHECFEIICEDFKRLTELDLGCVERLEDIHGVRLFCFEKLRSLTFSEGFGFTDLTSEGQVRSSALESLTILGSCITDAGLRSIAAHHNRLEKLILDDCREITYAGVVALLQNEPRLKEFSLVNSTPLPKGWSTTFRTLCPRLRKWRIFQDQL